MHFVANLRYKRGQLPLIFPRVSVPVLTSNNTAYIVQQVVASLGREGVFAQEGTDYSVEMGSILRSVSVTRIVQSSD